MKVIPETIVHSN